MLKSYHATCANVHLNDLKIRRKRWLAVHLYLGLFTGAILAVIGFTGAISVFYIEMQEILNPDQIKLTKSPITYKQTPNLDDIISTAETGKPPGSQFFKVYYPRNDKVAYKLLYYVRDAAQINNGDGYYIFVDPYSMQFKGSQLWHPKGTYWGRPFVSFIMQLHWCLLQGKPGGIFVGVVAALSIISILTGLIVWWPLTGKFKQALSFKRHSGPSRFNFELHKSIGFYSAIVLISVLFSGIYMNLPAEINVLIAPFSTITRANAYEAIESSSFHSTPQNTPPISYSAAVASVERNYPSGDISMLTAPTDIYGVYVIQKRNVLENSRFVGHQTLVVDQYSGQIIYVYNAGTGSAGDVLLDWQWSLHSGHAFGWPGRILVLLAGLACPVLYVTGVIRWLQKRRAAKLHHAKQSPAYESR